MNLTSNKIGNVTVQAVAKITEVNTSGSTNNVTKYYTGTQIFAVGTGSVGDVVVLSIGSHEILSLIHILEADRRRFRISDFVHTTVHKSKAFIVQAQDKFNLVPQINT